VILRRLLGAWLRAPPLVAQEQRDAFFRQGCACQRNQSAGHDAAVPVLAQADIARMRPVQAVDVPPSETIVFRRGGRHIMLVDVDAPLEEGETFPLTLVFERSGRVQVDARIGKPGDMVTPGR
jgi:hypothetical protein